MPVPDFQSLMLPVLKAFAGGRALPTSEARGRVAAAEGLSDEDVREPLRGGNQSVFTNRVSWAIVHMGRAGLLERVRRGAYRITGEGDRLLSSGPSRIDIGLLREYSAYAEWRATPRPTDSPGSGGRRKQNGDSHEPRGPMPVPDYQSLMLPALRALAGGGNLHVSKIRELIAASERLSVQDVREMLPSGNQTVFSNRVSWTVMHLERAELLERVRRGVYRITPEGKRLLSRAPSRIDVSVLEEYPSYTEWQERVRTQTPAPDTSLPLGWTDDLTERPEEALHRAAGQLISDLEAEVLHRVRNSPPAFLMRAVVDVLIAMGYSVFDAATGRATGRLGDGEISCKIRKDALGLNEAYVQAKKYAEGRAVDASDLHNFAGAVDAAGTTKGVFVTTADFTSAAENYVARSPKRIRLIGGEELAHLMVRHGIGVRTRFRYEVKRIDEDYFE